MEMKLDGIIWEGFCESEDIKAISKRQNPLFPIRRQISLEGLEGW